MENEIIDHLMTRGLTTREAEIAAATSEGLTNLQTACRFFVTEKTVKFHLTNVYRKTGLKNRSQLVDYIKHKFNIVTAQPEPPKPEPKPEPPKPVGFELPRGEK